MIVLLTAELPNSFINIKFFRSGVGEDTLVIFPFYDWRNTVIRIKGFLKVASMFCDENKI